MGEENHKNREYCVLITGGAKRIGRSLALAFAAKGYDIALHYNTSKKEAIRTAKDIQHYGVRCHLYQGDLCDSSWVETLIATIDDTQKDTTLTGIINSASVFGSGDLSTTALTLFQQMHRIHVEAPFILSRDFAAGYTPSSLGFIINILDAAISTNDRTHSAYLLSKKNLKDLTVMSALEWAPRIRVNAIAPGPVLAPPGKDTLYLKEKSTAIPSQKTVDVQSLTSTALMLAHNVDIMGQIIYVDGGQHL